MDIDKGEARNISLTDNNIHGKRSSSVINTMETRDANPFHFLRHAVCSPIVFHGGSCSFASFHANGVAKRMQNTALPR